MDAMVARTRLELGGRCLEDGDYQSGIVAYNAALQRSPEVPTIAPPRPAPPAPLPTAPRTVEPVPRQGKRAAEARRGLEQCRKGLKLDALGESGVDDVLVNLGVPQWGAAEATPPRRQEPEPEPEPEPSAELIASLRAEVSQLRQRITEQDGQQVPPPAGASDSPSRGAAAMRSQIQAAMKAEKQRRALSEELSATKAALEASQSSHERLRQEAVAAAAAKDAEGAELRGSLAAARADCDALRSELGAMERRAEAAEALAEEEAQRAAHFEARTRSLLAAVPVRPRDRAPAPTERGTGRRAGT